MMTQTISDKALARIRGYSQGHVFTPKDFLDLTTHENARAILSRLARKGTIRRLLRGVYENPARSRLLGAPESPNPDAIARAIGRAHGWTLVPGGDAALNLLGLSTQVPAQWTYFSDGPSKRHTWEGGTLIMKHRANKETTSLSPRTALLVQALKTLGAERVDKSVLARLGKTFTPRELAAARNEARYSTSWVYEIIKKLGGQRA